MQVRVLSPRPSLRFVMKVYLITEAEMDNLHLELEKSFRQLAERHVQNWNTSFQADRDPSIYDNYRTANYVARTWQSKVGK